MKKVLHTNSATSKIPNVIMFHHFKCLTV